MLKGLLILFVFACVAHHDAFGQTGQTDTALLLPSAIWSSILNPSRPQNESDNSAGDGANSQQNYVDAHPIFLVYAGQISQLQRSKNLLGRINNEYLVTPGMGAHKLHLRKVTWNKARRHCIEEGGQLAIINSVSEEKILERILEENKVDRAWLGIHDLYEEGDWTTVTGQSIESVGFDTWSKKYQNNPDNYAQKQHCGSLEPPGMDDIDCATPLPFFCEIPA